jgi:predicted HTH transcriptional regulator
VALGSFSHGALVDLSSDDLSRMLELYETLFVEHKSDISQESAHGLVRAVASFANTVGGWLLIGVKDSRPTGAAMRWTASDAPTLVDAVRDILRGEIDPLPAFEARVIDHPEGPVGVVRVYESSDTPHVVLRSGSVFVREVAGNADASAPKRVGGVLVDNVRTKPLRSAIALN